MKSKLLIVSWYGMNPVGGLERVTQYMYEVWKNQFDIEIIDFENMRKSSRVFRKLLRRHYVLDSILTSIYVNKLQKQYNNEWGGVKVITQGFNAPFVKADLAIAHGTMRGLRMAMSGKRIRMWKPNQRFEQFAFQHAKKVVAVSESVRNEVHHLYQVTLEKIEVLENCVDTEWFVPSNQTEEHAKYRVLFVGRLEAIKGLELLEKFSDRIECEEDIELHIATPDVLNVKRFLNRNNTFVYMKLDYQQIKRFYQCGDILLFPSIYESFGMVITEGMACGLPILGNNVGAIVTMKKRNAKGIYLLEADLKADLKKVREIGKKYRNIDLRWELYEEIKKYYDKEFYQKRLRRLL